MFGLAEALQRAEDAFKAEVARTSDLSNTFTAEDAQRLVWLSETYEAAKKVYFDSLTEGMKAIPQA